MQYTLNWLSYGNYLKKKINDDFAVAFKRLQNKNVITF